jgi:hypothetical protein
MPCSAFVAPKKSVTAYEGEWVVTSTTQDDAIQDSLLTLKMPEAMVARLDQWAAAHGMSQSDAVGQPLDFALQYMHRPRRLP